MKARPLTWLAALAVVGCQPSICVEPDAGADAPESTAVDAGPPPPDVGALADGCDLVSPAGLEVAPARLARSANDTPACAEAYRYRVFRAEDGAPVGDSGFGITCSHGFTVPPGDYDLAVDRNDDTAWYVGGALTRPERCPLGVVPTPPYCVPIRVHVRPCGVTTAFAVLYCDPGSGPCPDVTWPWELPP